jgi:PAS domain S-box-containing protein
MTWQASTAGLWLLAAGALLAALAVSTERAQPTPTRRGLLALLASAAIWVLFAAGEHLLADPAAKLACARLEYAGIASLPVSVLALALQVCGRGGWIRARRLALLSAIPCAAFLLAATNDWHHLIWREWRVAERGGLIRLVYTHGPAFWLFNFYSHALLAISGRLLVAHYRRAGRDALGEAVLMGAGFSTPWIANLLYVSGLSPWADTDPTPFGLAVTGSCFAIALWSRERLFDVLHLARGALIDVIDDAALVADLRGRLVYANPAARRLLGLGALALPAPLDVALSEQPELVASLRGSSRATAISLEVAASGDAAERSFDLRVSRCLDRRGQTAGHIAVLRDVTDRALADRAARRSEAWLRRVIDLVPHYLYAKDADGRFLLANAAVARAYQRATDEVIGRFQRELQSDVDGVRRSIEADRRVIESGRPESVEHQMRLPSGRVFQLETTRIPYVDAESGRRCVVGLSIDITRQT